MHGLEGQIQILTFLEGGLVFDFYWLLQWAEQSEEKCNLSQVI